MTPRHARLVAALALAAFSALGQVGCTTTTLDARRLEAPTIADASVAGPGVDVSNLRGDVSIRVNPRAKGITVIPTVRLDKDGPEHYDLDLVVNSIDVVAEVQDRGGLPALVVTTTSSFDPSGFFVDLDIRLPAAEGVRVRSGGDGVVSVVDAGGAIDVESVRGAIEVRTSKPLTGPVAISTGAGDVYLMAPPESTGRVTMRAYGGKCVLEALSPRTLLHNVVSRGDSLTGVVNSGQNPVTLTTTSGNARMFLLDRPLERVGVSRLPFGR